MKTIYLKVKIHLEDDANVNDVVWNVDYTFNHPDIIDTEIINVSDFGYRNYS